MFYSFDYRGATIHTQMVAPSWETTFKIQLPGEYIARPAASLHAAKCRITRALHTRKAGAKPCRFK